MCLKTHDSGIKLLIAKAKNLEESLKIARSPDVRLAIEEALHVVAGLANSREEIVRTSNSLSKAMHGGELH